MCRMVVVTGVSVSICFEETGQCWIQLTDVIGAGLIIFLISSSDRNWNMVQDAGGIAL